MTISSHADVDSRVFRMSFTLKFLQMMLGNMTRVVEVIVEMTKYEEICH